MYSIVDDILLSRLSEFILSPTIYNEFMLMKPEPKPTPIKIKPIVYQFQPQLPPIEIEVFQHSGNLNFIRPADKIEVGKDDLVVHATLELTETKSKLFHKTKLYKPFVINKQRTQKTPEQDDTLFWCLFIQKFGKEEYNLIGSKYKNFEIQEKMKIVEYLNENKNALKCMKITKTATQEIMGKLMTNITTDLQVVHGICAYYKLHIIVVCNSKKSYIEYKYSENDTDVNDILVVFKSNSLLSNSRCKYSIKFDVIAKDIINDFVKFVSFDKPFNGISTYKLPELEIIHEKLGLEIVKKNKIELFSQINLAVA